MPFGMRRLRFRELPAPIWTCPGRHRKFAGPRPVSKSRAFHTRFTEMLEDEGTLDLQPGFVPVFRGLGINIAMMPDFHGDGHVKDPGPIRFREQKDYFDGCRCKLKIQNLASTGLIADDPKLLILQSRVSVAC